MNILSGLSQVNTEEHRNLEERHLFHTGVLLSFPLIKLLIAKFPLQGRITKIKNISALHLVSFQALFAGIFWFPFQITTGISLVIVYKVQQFYKSFQPVLNNSDEETIMSNSIVLVAETASFLYPNAPIPNDSLVERRLNWGTRVWRQLTACLIKKDINQQVREQIPFLEAQLATLNNQINTINKLVRESPELMQICKGPWKDFANFSVEPLKIDGANDIDRDDPIEIEKNLSLQIAQKTSDLEEYKAFVKAYPAVEEAVRAHLQ